MNVKKVFFGASFLMILFFAVPAGAVNIGDGINFNVDETFERDSKSQVPALLVKTSPNLYFYIEKAWWDAQVVEKQNEILRNLDALSLEFDNNIYPNLTSVFGSEWKPGVDGDNKITLLFHAMKENIGGYFRTADEYLKIQIPISNEREMLYLPIGQIENNNTLKVFLAHELTHLITFNQKDRLLGVQEEVWLNEARAEYAITLLGYNHSYSGSNLQSRVRDFLEKPSDSLTEWQGSKSDYGVVNVFIHYLADHYGVNILSDSLKLKSVGITSINEILLKNGYQENFQKIFTDWTIALILGSCSNNIKYCYLTSTLSNFKINPTLIFLPFSGDSSLSLTNVTKNWTGNWQKIIGGNGDLALEFSSLAGLNFKIPYLIFDKDNKYLLNFLALDQNQKGRIDIKNFGSQYTALIIIPSLQTKMSDFSSVEPTYPYTFKVSITSDTLKDDPAVIQALLDQIEALNKQIAALQAAKGTGQSNSACPAFSNNLYFGITNNSQVSCLQAFLKSQGADIYPEGLVTGNFGTLTRAAVIRFQEKYRADILIPAGLSRGTGFVGILTRTKINALLNEG